VDLGIFAAPALEEALDSFEARAKKSEVALKARWLLLAYARIKGQAAYPRLRRLYDNTSLAEYAIGLDSAVALALGLTSYVSALRGMQMQGFHQCSGANSTVSLSRTPCVAPAREIPYRTIRCDRGAEPKDTLDRLILAWETDDRVSLEASLGPAARAALDRLVEGKTWAAMRAEFRSNASGRAVAMGYRFALSGRWSEPDETLEEEGRQPIGRISVNPEIDTLFKNNSGGDCGKFRLMFRDAPPNLTSGPGRVEYAIDNANLAELLRLISACETDTVPAR
jgi:hypothetical protein